jgi:O-antigen/teichoic acid export membrane protein
MSLRWWIPAGSLRLTDVHAAKQDATAALSKSGSPSEEPPAHTTPAGAPQSIWRRVRRDVVLLGAGNIGIVIAQLCFRSILIAILVPAAYGRLSLVLSVYNTVWIIGATGLPSSAARYIALIAPGDDSAIIRSAIRAGVWPTIVAAAIVATVSGLILNSPLAFLFGAVGLSSLVYMLLTAGILRGRGRIGPAASIMPIACAAEVALLATLWRSGLGVTPLSAFGVFCLGNIVGLGIGIFWIARTAPHRDHAVSPDNVPSPRELLGFSVWLGAAAVGVAVLPLALRLAATVDSYTVVAIVDVALVLFTIPQRMGAVIVAAVIPHATRALDKGHAGVTISRREHLIVIMPFVLVAAVILFTPIVGWGFDALGRPEYGKSADYLALALLAGPARILYGLVEGVLVAHGEARFIALNASLIAAGASVAILAATALGSIVAAFAAFVVAFWAIYLCGLQRVTSLNSVGGRSTVLH